MRVLIVEDDQFHASYLQDAISDALPEVTETLHATDGARGEAEGRTGGFEAVVMDLQLTRRNGIEAARTIWQERPKTRILFWSNYADEAYLRGIARIVPDDSAYGYVIKTSSRERLMLALRAVLVEGQIMVDRQLHTLSRRTDPPGNALNESEYAVLVDLALGLPDKLIAERQSMSLRTVQNRLLSLYDKLGVDDGSAAPLNKRVCALNRAFRIRILNVDTLNAAQIDLDRWLAERAPGDRS